MAFQISGVTRSDPARVSASPVIAGPPGGPGPAGPSGAAGQRGLTGATGRGITSVATDSNNNFLVTYTDGATQNVGTIVVPPATGGYGGTF